MIFLNLSKTFAKDMRAHIADDESSSDSEQQWYAHRITLNRRKCVIAMQEHSRYAMFFCALMKKDFQHFSDLFQERLWREVLAICPGLDDEAMAKLSDYVLSTVQKIHYQPGHDRSVSSHIRQAVDELDSIVNYHARGLPATTAQSINLDLRLNTSLRKIGKKSDYFVPLEVFRDSWLTTCGLDYRPVEKLDFLSQRQPPALGKASARVIYPDFTKQSSK